jgi:hypothetical protein
LAQEVEALRIVAQVALALVSVTIPTYAISASFLGKETARTMLQIQRRRKETERRIASEAKDIQEMQAAIRRYTLEEQNLKSRLSRISLTGVVGAPAIFYVSALFTTLAGIYESPNPVLGATPVQTLFISLVLIMIGSVFLGTALQAIERVAREEEMVPPAGKIEAEAKPATEMAISVSAHYFVDTAPSIQKLVVDWRRKVAYYFDARVEQAVREGKIAAFAEPSANQLSWTDKQGFTLVPRAPKTEELSLTSSAKP